MSLYLGTNLVSGVATPIQGARNIGQIIQSTIPLTDAGLHLLDGSVISGDGVYGDFYNYIAGIVNTYPNLFITEAAWQAEVASHGVCGKFVFYEPNRTVRLPKITGITQSSESINTLGDYIQAGLPNITGKHGATTYSSTSEFQGAFYNDGTTTNTASGGDSYRPNVCFDASRSSSIYGNSPTVQPPAIKVLYYIVVANSTKTDIEVDIDEIVTDLNGKADIDLSNCTKPHIVETYVNGTSWYRIYSDGWCEQGGVSGTESTTRGQTINIVFVKNFINTDYTVIAIDGNTSKSTYSASVSITSVLNGTKTVSGVSISSYGFASGDVHGVINWKTCGYIS